MVTLDNFGIFLSGHFVNPTTGINVQLINTSGASQTVKIIGNSSNEVWNDTNLGTMNDFIQVGSGNTPATRQDFKLETPFGTSPESARFVCIPAGYNSGLGKITITGTLASTGGAGTINETTKEVRINQNTSPTNIQSFIFFRDNISPVAFIIGQQIVVDYEVLI